MRDILIGISIAFVILVGGFFALALIAESSVPTPREMSIEVTHDLLG